MKVCTVCSAKNDDAAFACAICDHSLDGVPANTTTLVLDNTTRRYPSITWGDIHLKPDAVLVLYILTTGQLKVLPKSNELIIGRAGAAGLQPPDIDLTPYGALEGGVSRRHAALKIQDEAVFISDLGSLNGTYLNDSVLKPGEARILRTGDEVRFANLATQLFYRVPTNTLTP